MCVALLMGMDAGRESYRPMSGAVQATRVHSPKESLALLPAVPVSPQGTVVLHIIHAKS